MHFKPFLCLGFIALFMASSYAQTSKRKMIGEPIEQSWYNVDSLLYHVEVLSSDAFEGRRTGTKGAEMAKAYIKDQFERYQVIPLVINYEQEFTFDQRNKTYEGTNILGQIVGTQMPEDYIVITAHYDHEGIKNGKIYNGADDDASGVSALFAFAEYFQKYPPKHSVILAAVDAEELGLVGSEYYVNNSIIDRDRIRMNINMDMISRSDRNELFVVGTRYNRQYEPLIKSMETQGGLNLVIGHDGSDRKANWTYSSDHASFHVENIPFLYFGVADHEDYHKPTDDFENIHPVFFQNAVTSIISVFQKLDDM